MSDKESEAMSWIKGAVILFLVVYILGIVFMIFYTPIKLMVWFIRYGRYEMTHSAADRPYAFTLGRVVITPYTNYVLGGAGCSLITILWFLISIPYPKSPIWTDFGTAFVISAPATIGLPVLFYGLVMESYMLINYNGWVGSNRKAIAQGNW
jgi:hypothetical protein